MIIIVLLKSCFKTSFPESHFCELKVGLSMGPSELSTPELHIYTCMLIDVCIVTVKAYPKILPRGLVNDRSNKRLHVDEKCCFSLHVGVLLQRMSSHSNL